MVRHVPDVAEQRRDRNYIIVCLELSSSFAEQLEYQERVPIAQVSAEVLEHWSDVYHPDAPDYYTPPTYSGEELAAMSEFQKAWEAVCANTPDSLPEISVMQSHPEWSRLREAAQTALNVFLVRGRSPGD